MSTATTQQSSSESRSSTPKIRYAVDNFCIGFFGLQFAANENYSSGL
jgi:hypothetical protein